MSANKFDLVILGSGSTAFAAAHRAAELGKTAAMTENRTLGGTCVNRGCLPSKNLIEAARIYWEARHPRYPGLKPATMGLDFHRLISQKDEIVADFREKKYQSGVTADGSIQVFYGDAAFIFPHAVQVGETVLESDRFLIATGSRPAIPDISGLAETPFLTSDLLTVNEGLELWELPESLIIVGAGYIALELGQMFAHLGSRVTLLERGDQILSRYEPEIGLEMQHLLAEEGITVLLRTSVNAVQRGGNGIEVDVTVDGKRRRLAAERLLVATGRVPNTADIGLEQAGVATIPGGWVKVDSNLRTSAVHIFAAGDAIGPQTDNQLATPVGAHDGGIAAANALTSQPKSVDHRVIPRVIFTDPQIATVGLTDAEANARGYGCRCNTIPMKIVPRAGAIRDTRGLVKMVLEADTHKVLGVSMIGVNAGEVIHEAAMGLRFGATAEDFIDLVHVYPTMAEALKIVAISFFKDVAHLSCCAE